MMTFARRRALCRQDSTSATFGLELLLMMKFKDLEASSPRTAEIKISIISGYYSLFRKITQQVEERIKW